jgi:purine-nucleoside phosphorylase
VHALAERCRARASAPPDVLCLLATGVALVPERLAGAREVVLGELGAPPPWRAATLHAGRIGGLSLWALEDLSGEPLPDEAPAAPWARVLPVWLAAASGARVLVHASAGCALGGRARAGDLAVVQDHLNLCAENPLLGLAGSVLGPLFPDRSRLHHAGLAQAALARAAELGFSARTAVAACTAGPALETPAERRMYAALGADVAVQSLSLPLLAAAHAGLAVLALVLATDAGLADVGAVLETGARHEHALERWILALAPDLEAAARALAARDGG